MEQVEIAYRFCPECRHPVYILKGDNTFHEYHDLECSRTNDPEPCQDVNELEVVATMLYVILQPRLN